jgi:hypothetical protein
MGCIYYGARDTPFEFDDRVLAHLEAVIVSKLRRNESFAFSFHPGPNVLWLSSSVSLQFAYSSEKPPLNREWLQRLASAAERGTLRIVPETDDA